MDGPLLECWPRLVGLCYPNTLEKTWKRESSYHVDTQLMVVGCWYDLLLSMVELFVERCNFLYVALPLLDYPFLKLAFSYPLGLFTITLVESHFTHLCEVSGNFCI